MENKNPTWKSTMFIANIVVILMTLLGAIQQYLKPETAAIISACLTAVFTGTNAYLKGQRAPYAPVVPPAEPPKP